jgi:uncharacterized SAM-binding protein YcdF (DUF218 family)
MMKLFRVRRVLTLRAALLLVMVLPVVWATYLIVSILLFSHRVSGMSADAAVVLGAAVANSVPTPVFEQRIRHAIDLYQSGRVKKLVLTGGVGYGDRIAESEAARDYCMKRQVPTRDMLLEVRSHSTMQNLEEARSILDTNHLRTVLLVSDPLHMRRAITQAQDLGIVAHPSPTPTSLYRGFKSKVQFLLRETYFYGRYLLLERNSRRNRLH